MKNLNNNPAIDVIWGVLDVISRKVTALFNFPGNYPHLDCVVLCVLLGLNLILIIWLSGDFMRLLIPDRQRLTYVGGIPPMPLDDSDRGDSITMKVAGQILIGVSHPVDSHLGVAALRLTRLEKEEFIRRGRFSEAQNPRGTYRIILHPRRGYRLQIISSGQIAPPSVEIFWAVKRLTGQSKR